MCRDYLADNLRRLNEIKELIKDGQYEKALEQIRLNMAVLNLLLEAEAPSQAPSQGEGESPVTAS